MGYLYANFSLPRPLCSRLRPDVRVRQTSDAHHRLMHPTLGGGITTALPSYGRERLCRVDALIQGYPRWVLLCGCRGCALSRVFSSFTFTLHPFSFRRFRARESLTVKRTPGETYVWVGPGYIPRVVVSRGMTRS